MTELTMDRLRENLESLKMKNTLEILDNYLERAVKDELNIVEVLDHIFAEEALSKRRRAYEKQVQMSGFAPAQKAQASANAAEAELQELLETSEGLKHEYDQLLSWADLYDKSSFEAKKMIVSQFIKAVRVGKNYNIEVDFNVSFEELQGFCTGNVRQDKMQAPESRTA